MRCRAALAAVVLCLAAAACLPRWPGGRAEPRGTPEGPPDSVAVVVDNRNYLAATVRLLSSGSQVRRISVTGLASDTVYVQRGQLRPPGDVAAVIELVGSRQAHRVPRQILPADVSLIEIHVAELLRSSSMAVY